MKTLEYFKDEVAKIHSYKGASYKSWKNMETQLILGVPECSKSQSAKDLVSRFQIAALLYALYCCEQQRIICAEHARLHVARKGSDDMVKYAHQDHALGYDITPFKPSILTAPLFTATST